MQTLDPCSNCHRHVRVQEERCPFCGELRTRPAQQLPTRPLGRAASSPERFVVPRRLGSAALFSFRAAVAASGITACGADAENAQPAHPPDMKQAKDAKEDAAEDQQEPTETADGAGIGGNSTAEDPQQGITVEPDSLTPVDDDIIVADPENDAGLPIDDIPEDDHSNPVNIYRAPPTDPLPRRG